MINQPSKDEIMNSKNYSSPRKVFHSSTQKCITQALKSVSFKLKGLMKSSCQYKGLGEKLAAQTIKQSFVCKAQVILSMAKLPSSGI
ncbi:hypothetical protein LR48_Vigan08g090700 [Vigna angularis]|uniref:Uncharacterized protein n=1 Tax=Phaseolus angularis TaxID=3914 RepID=A0A0L9V4S7_PHAAN|nr:hypothetical protein LR48_Vigan08g090700 [Vigna angularis]